MNKVLLLGCNKTTELILPGIMRIAAVSEIIIAAKDKAECDELRKKYSGTGPRITTARVDLDNIPGVKMMLSITNPDLIVNISSPEICKTVMELALGTDADYIDSFLYECGKGDLLSSQFELFGEFRNKGRMAIAGCSLDPSVFTAVIRSSLREDFDAVDSVDIVKLNLDIEDTDAADAAVISNGELIRADALALGDKAPSADGVKLRLSDSAATQSILREIPGIPEVRCYVSYADKKQADYTEELNRLGMLSDEPLEIFPGVSISPREFWEKLVLSRKEPDTLKGSCETYLTVKGKYRGSDKKKSVRIKGDNDECFEKYGLSFREYLDAMALLNGVRLLCSGKWTKSGVFTPSVFDPDTFVSGLKSNGVEFEINEE